MFYRTALKKLTEWARKKDRKPLILRGARQVGKTSLVNIFSKKYEQYIYLNLELETDRKLFENNISIQNLYQAILLSKNYSSKAKTLLFIDEIQNSFKAISLLRYFYEFFPELHVIAAGSLLEAVIDENMEPYPVGRVEHFFLYPLTFEEYLQAIEATRAISAYNTIPLPEWSLEKLLEYFHTFSLIGGMPEIIAAYIEQQHDITALNDIYQSLLQSYLEDVSKYTRKNTERKIITHCIESAPFSAGKRIKFANFGNSNYRSREIGESLKILERAMLIRLIYPSTSYQLPIIPDFKKHPKLQFLDTGLINYFTGLQQYFLTKQNLHSFYRGLIAEHIVMQEFIAYEQNNLKKHCFWVRESKSSNAEIDYLFQYQDILVPVEIKSGPTGRLRSLHLFMENSDSPVAVRLFSSKFSVDNLKTKSGRKYKLINLPYFLTGKIQQYIELVLS